MTDFPDLNSLLGEGYALRGDKKWPTYLGGHLDRTQYVTASEVGGCSRRIKFGKVSRPLKPGFSRWGFAERGHLIEAWAIDLVRLALEDVENYRLMFAGEQQFSFVDQFQAGTPDGLLVNLDTHKGMCIDVKSVDPRTNWSKLPKKKHVDQVQQNMDLLNSVTPYEVKHGALWYIDASDLQRRKVFPFEADWRRQKELQEKAERIMKAASPEDMPAEGLHMEKECEHCDFSDKCSDLIRAQHEKSKEMEQAERAMNVVFGKP